mmetsp:Transcript_4025/g.5911  ORF Transcript_4025/g.5911 Transcript_4025/m.5911 type:complete len:249 (-) Transcript_4025:80-826(-)
MKATTPTLQMSVGRDDPSPRSVSGEAVYTVPLLSDSALPFSTRAEKPKSISLITLSLSLANRIFSSLISRWHTSLACICARAFNTCPITSAAPLSSIARARSVSFPPVHSSITSHSCLFTRNTSNSWMILGWSRSRRISISLMNSAISGSDMRRVATDFAAKRRYVGGTTVPKAAPRRYVWSRESPMLCARGFRCAVSAAARTDRLTEPVEFSSVRARAKEFRRRSDGFFSTMDTSPRLPVPMTSTMR